MNVYIAVAIGGGYWCHDAVWHWTVYGHEKEHCILGERC